jgi:hypothetical protein
MGDEMKTMANYVQRASEAAWIISHLREADKKLFSGDPELQRQGAAERSKYLTKWERWEKANPEEAKIAWNHHRDIIISSVRTTIKEDTSQDGPTNIVSITRY